MVSETNDGGKRRTGSLCRARANFRGAAGAPAIARSADSNRISLDFKTLQPGKVSRRHRIRHRQVALRDQSPTRARRRGDPLCCTNDADRFSHACAVLRSVSIIISTAPISWPTSPEWLSARTIGAFGEQYLMATSAALAHPVSRQWKGYWQR